MGTTVKAPEHLPQDLVADEQHSRLAGEKLYLAMTAGAGCMLGAAVSDSAAEAALQKAYGVFAEEARALAPDYAPETVNTDGWAATPGAWKSLFPRITLILCCLHALLKIRERATTARAECFAPVSKQVWQAYRAPRKASLAQRLRRRREWAHARLPASPMQHPTLDWCEQRAQFSRCYEHERAHRTRNRVDRLMQLFDRACFNAQYFHGTVASAELRVRALALLWNFCPSAPATV